MFEIKYDRNGKVISSPPPSTDEQENTEAQQKPADHQEEPDNQEEQPQEEHQEALVENTEQETKPAETEDAAPEKKLTNREENWRRLRAKQEEIERERDEAQRRLKELEERYSQSSTQASPSPERTQKELLDRQDNLLSQINDDDFVEGKTLKKLYQDLKETQSQLKKYQQVSSEMAINQQLNAQYPDFTQVVNQENIKLLRDMYPEVATSLHNSSSDLYNKMSSLYTLIKRFGLYEEPTYKKDRDRAQANAKKPRPLASVSPQQGNTPLSHANEFANGLTDDLKKKLREEMERARQNL